MPALPMRPRPYRFRLVTRDAAGGERDVGLYTSAEDACEIGELIASRNHVFEICAIEPAACDEDEATLLVQPVI
jgi:hypothetical protein